MLLRAGRVKTAMSKLSRKLSSASRASMEKKKRNTRKWPVQKKSQSSDSDSSDESINVMEPGQRIPCKKRYAQRTIRFDARGNQVNIEDSDSDDDRKMPAKISHKKPKKVADPVDTESSEETDEDEDFKASKEEKAFLKSLY
jgi:hypothetical protein